MNNTTKAAQVEKQTADEQELAAINRHTLRELSAEEVFTFSLAACDNQVDRDDERFSDATLHELAQMYPGKPVLLDHNWSAKDQSGRVYAAEVREDEARAGVKRLILRCFVPRLEATKDFIEAIETGLKKECSVGCAVKHRKCSICGEDYYESCLHIRGQEYNGQRCHVVLEGAADAYEVSMVAVPAQKEAGIIKSGEEKPREDWKKSARAVIALERDRFGALRP